MPIETLYCQTGQHDFTRERKRGVKPSICPDCKAQSVTVRETVAATVQAISDEVLELVQMYREEGNSLPRRVLAAFIGHGIEPPPAARVDRIGYTTAERHILEGLLTDLPEIDV